MSTSTYVPTFLSDRNCPEITCYTSLHSCQTVIQKKLHSINHKNFFKKFRFRYPVFILTPLNLAELIWAGHYKNHFLTSSDGQIQFKIFFQSQYDCICPFDLNGKQQVIYLVNLFSLLNTGQQNSGVYKQVSQKDPWDKMVRWNEKRGFMESNKTRISKNLTEKYAYG